MKRFVKNMLRLVVTKKQFESILDHNKYKEIKEKQLSALDVAKTKDHIKVTFFLIISSNWKYDSVYKAFDGKEHYSPSVVICPLVGHGDDAQKEEMLKAKMLCEINKYNYFESWDDTSNTWKDIKSILKPDIIFFSNPHNITRDEYCIDNYLDSLTCYVPYSIRTDHLVDLAFNSPFQQLTWINFYETIIHKEIAEECTENRGANVVVVGYPTVEMIDSCSLNKTQNKIKKIIWAPHWTINESPLLNRACFLEYHKFFIELAKQYIDLVEIVLRPHPFLKRTLYDLDGWGKKRTDDYFDLWQTSTNLSINEGDYCELFASSDILVHDSVSFLAEYLVTGKPAIFTKRKVDSDPPFNKFGILCLEAHYICKSTEQLHDLIVDLLFNDKDIKVNDRQSLVKKYLRLGKTASENIFTTIEESLNG